MMHKPQFHQQQRQQQQRMHQQMNQQPPGNIQFAPPQQNLPNPPQMHVPGGFPAPGSFQNQGFQGQGFQGQGQGFQGQHPQQGQFDKLNPNNVRIPQQHMMNQGQGQGHAQQGVHPQHKGDDASIHIPQQHAMHHQVKGEGKPDDTLHNQGQAQQGQAEQQNDTPKVDPNEDTKDKHKINIPDQEEETKYLHAFFVG